MYDFIPFKMDMPAKTSGIYAQIIFLNDKMEILEVFDKRVYKGRFIYVASAMEPAESKSIINIRRVKPKNSKK